MTQLRTPLANSIWSFRAVRAWATLALGLALFASPAFAQQTGDIAGHVTDAAGAGISGVSIEARGDVLPQARKTSSGENGEYRFRLLPPGNYTLKFTFSDGATSTRNAAVLLQQRTIINVATGAGAEMEEIVTIGSQMMADTGQGSLKNSITAETVDALPVGQQYRDLLKLIPGVQYSENTRLGPSSGGSASDNTFMFDGIDVSLPLFGNLASEPSTHDIAQISIVRGGAKAIGFNRAGGFSMNTISKSGTDEFHGEVSYQTETKGMRSDLDTGDSPEEFDEDRSWTTLSLGGPLVRDRLYFYTSYYGPRTDRSNGENAYGAVPDYEITRDEIFGKLTFSPTDNILIDASYRTSEKETLNDGVGARTQASAADVGVDNQDILTLEGSWIISDQSSLSFRYVDWENETGGDPVTFLNFTTSLGDSIDVNNLDQMGGFLVPNLEVIDAGDTPAEIADKQAFNAFVQPLINQYGYLDNGVPTGGGLVGSGGLINSQDFFRESFEISFDHLIYAGNMTHDLHFGFQQMEIEEVLDRRSNGWGTISVPFNELAEDGVTPVFYRAAVRQQGLGSLTGEFISPVVHSLTEMTNIEINDTIEMGDWTYNVGFLISQDTLYGQGLAKNASNPSGFEIAIGQRYEMQKFDFSDMIQPRFGANWDYSDSASAYINYARYHPTASSLSRAASWDRRFGDRIMDVNFDVNGNFIDAEQQSGSGGKLWEANVKPRSVDEWLIGWTKDVSGELSIRAHARYKKGDHFLEDVPNDIYLYGNPPDSYAREEVIPGLETLLDGVVGDGSDGLGGGSIRSFVVDELDGAFSKYYELSFEADYNTDRFAMTGSYTWSHYYGNFDNDNVSGDNDRDLFIGSSSFGDGAGRMPWNNQKGDLRGDRRHMLKVYGHYQLDWDASVGAFLLWQSGQPWTPWDDDPWADEIAAYRAATGRGTSTSTFLRFAEPAGSNRTPSHVSLDLNYKHNFEVFGDQNIQLRVDLFNVFDNQTGYNYQTRVDFSDYGEPRDWFRPRRFQLAVKYQF
ncbi:MAG: carboxypeptidase regulatory-like domain-containing protein [Gammaproteobacteria bacterium]|nr:carboxypeptidase regulatory-like domain-containing protein [Gammaproteobacteria bacterium]